MDSPDGEARVAKYSGVKVGCFPHHSSALHCTSTLPKSLGYPKSELNVFPFYLFFTPITFLYLSLLYVIEPEREIQYKQIHSVISSHFVSWVFLKQDINHKLSPRIFDQAY